MKVLFVSAGIVVLAVGAGAARLDENTRIDLAATLPEKAELTLSFGRGREKLTVSSQKDGYPWTFSTTTGADPQKRAYPGATREEKSSYWWEHCAYTPNGRYKRSFSVPEWVDDASDYLESPRRQKPSERKLRLAVELSDGWLSFYLDDILIHALRATADVVGRELVVKGSKTAVLSKPVVTSVTSARGFYRVPLGNVATAERNPAAALTEFRGIPFLPAAKSVDLSRSWVREACVDGYGAPNEGTFGGRWAGALSATPCRLQFRVPNRRYEALYLIASCRERNFLTVQFYRPGAGFPVEFVPAEPIAADGELKLVRVLLRQDLLATFADREILEFELTGHVEDYRANPEPSHASRHGVGVPSGVLVHAATLKESELEIDFTPEAFGNVWTGLKPSPAYVLALRNRSSQAKEVGISLETRSWDGRDVTSQSRTLSVAPGGEASLRLDVPVRKYGWHAVRLTAGGEAYERSMAVLHPRTFKSRPFETPGLMFGSWPVGRGLHFGLPAYDACRLAFPLGIEGFAHGHACKRSEVAPLAEKYGVKDFLVADFNSSRPSGYTVPDLESRLRQAAAPESKVSDPSFQPLFAEPGGIGRECSIAALCGEKVEPRSEAEEAKYQFFKTNLVRFAETYRRLFPDKKLLMPWGNPLFTVAYLRDPQTRNLMDGLAFDTAFFDRIAEGQLHSCSLYTLTLFNREWRKVRTDTPLITTIEGPCVSREAPGALTPAEHLQNILRANLILTANGVTRLLASVSGGAEAASYWGEQHYGGGVFSRLTLNPHAAYAAEATMVRLLRDCEFVRVVPTGNLGAFALEYRNVNSGEPLHVLWTVRGKMPFKVKARQFIDVMDNATGNREMTPEPIFVLGAKGEFSFGKQVFARGDVRPAADAVRIGSFGDWTYSSALPDAEYLQSMPACIVRHPIAMEVQKVGKGLSVALPANVPDGEGMPFTTTLVPPKPIVLPGRPRTIAVETTAVADWGRLVYVLRDAKGEKFVSVGQKGTYNVDDTRCASYFNFSGKRLVRFELPGNRPWDKSRYPGFCWWGASGGDGAVDYPLSLEKVFVERRDKAMYVNGLVPADRGPVTLGAIYVEDVEPDSDLLMPAPPSGRTRPNPLAEIKGTLPPTEMTEVRHPIHYYDGTRGHFSFREMPGATGYDVYVGLAPTGEGAILLKKGVKKSGELVKGFLAGRENYAFVVWHDKKGAVSQPSAPFKFLLKDEFAEK